MSRNLKVLGLALVAVLALCAVSASAAFALTPKVKVAEGDGNLDGVQTVTNIFTVSGGRTVTCGKVTFTASMKEVSSTVTVTPAYSECDSKLAGVVIPATVTMNGCDYMLHVGATNGTADTYAVTADLVCPEGKDVVIHVYPEGTKPSEHETKAALCVYTIQPQNGLGPITVTNNTEKGDIDGSLAVNNAAYTRTGTIPNCGAASGNATLSGGVTITGTTTAGAASTVQIVEV